MACDLSRREILTGTISAAAGAGCRMARPLPPSLVSIVRAPAYDQRIYATVRQVFQEHGLDVRGKSVVLKPNLVDFEAGVPVNTHPMVVHAALEAVRSLSAAQVRIAEGPANHRNTLDLAEAAGYFQTIPGFEDTFVDLNLDDVSLVHRNHFVSGLEKLYLPKTVLGADLLISIPKMKTHRWAGVTLSMKNLFGVVPGAVYGWPKNVLHWAGIPECVVDLHGLLRRKFALVDGIVAMEGEGPIHGTPKTTGVLVAGADPVAVDATCCRIMGLRASKIDYLRVAGLDRREIRQIGEPSLALSGRFKAPSTLSGLGLEMDPAQSI